MSDLEPPIPVDFSQGEFAHLPRSFPYEGTPPGVREGVYTVEPHFDYPGRGNAGRPKNETWDSYYFGSGQESGAEFPNTAYVHVFDHTFPKEQGSDDLSVDAKVFQYFYVYPYNDWLNNHEGDWPKINVVVVSNALVAGVEYFSTIST